MTRLTATRAFMSSSHSGRQGPTRAAGLCTRPLRWQEAQSARVAGGGEMQTDPRVEAHYSSPGIAERVLAALRASNGAPAPVTVDALAPLDHFHGGGVAA